jgi:hypothetical protein
MASETMVAGELYAVPGCLCAKHHLQIVTTSNYNALANSYACVFTTAHTKSIQSAVSSPVVSW